MGQAGDQGDPNPGGWFFHHNVVDARTQKSSDFRKHTTPPALWYNHSASGNQPWKMYNNILFHRPDVEAQQNCGLSHLNNLDNTSGVPHEVFNISSFGKARRGNPRPAIFSCCIFVVAFAALSLAATKHFNYILFALPFLFVIWGISLAEVIAVLWRWTVTVTDHAVAQVASGLPQRSMRWALITAGLLFLAVSNGAPARTLLKPFGIALRSDETSIDWQFAAAALQPWLEQAAIVLTPNDMHALYYLGDYDVAVNPSRMSEIEGAVQFSLDPRTGRPVIGTAASLRLIVSCYRNGVLIADETTFPLPWLRSEPITEAIRSTMTPIDLPEHRGMFAFRWDRSGAAPPPECASLEARLASGSSDG